MTRDEWSGRDRPEAGREPFARDGERRRRSDDMERMMRRRRADGESGINIGISESRCCMRWQDEEGRKPSPGGEKDAFPLNRNEMK
jgi:hypothetical protein